MKAKADVDPAQILRDWLTDNKSSRSTLRDIAVQLADHPEMRLAWKELTSRKIDPLQLLSIVDQARNNALKEVSRQQINEEAQQIDAVKRAIQNLQNAIEASPLPRNTATLRELRCEGRPPIPLMLSWRDLPHVEWKMGYPVSMIETLEFASIMVQEFEVAQLPRAVIRHRKSPEIAAFVRWLYHYMSHAFKTTPRGTIGHVTSAVFNLDDPLDKANIHAILKDAPIYFLTPKNRVLAP